MISLFPSKKLYKQKQINELRAALLLLLKSDKKNTATFITYVFEWLSFRQL